MMAFPEMSFDNSLVAFVKAITEQLGTETLAQGVVMRDASGRLRFFSDTEPPVEAKRSSIDEHISGLLGAYVRPEGAIAYRDEAGVKRIIQDVKALPVEEEGTSFRLLDRRIVGTGWLDLPQPLASGPPRLVFSSLKGGVGRSTALAVAASHFSRRNLNVLVVDLDLEAPGLGDILLDDERLPRFGTIDYLVENGMEGVGDQCLSDFVGTSALTNSLGGRVDVLPAVGRASLEHPRNTLPKLSRAMTEDVNSDGIFASVGSQIAEMVSRFVNRDFYDVVLIDIRAGLAEIAAPAILGLGATVLLFGTSQRQTIHGYAALFASLKMLAERDGAAGRSSDWRLQFKAVYAKASLDEEIGASYRDDLYDLFAENLYDVDDVKATNPDAVSFDIDDRDAPHWPFVIPFTQNFLDFDPVRWPNQLNSPFYEQAYRPFLDGLDSIVFPSEGTFDDARLK